ncbi:MAG: ROK family protein [Chloroflexia bacterium]|nr:ROK family protein [Chloroflexia bacterium]
MTETTLAVDLGGTNLRCSVVDRNGTIRAEERELTESERGVDTVIQRMADLIERVASDAGLDTDTPVGVVAPGPLDPKAGVVRFSPNLVGWTDVPLRDRLGKLTGRTVHLGNDANAAALGEFYFGAGKQAQHMVYVALGTGFGGGVISGGVLIDGVHGLGGELGHTCVSMDGPRCTCGSAGCVEAYCSGWAIARDGQSLVRSGRGDAIRNAAKDPDEIDARAVSSAAETGDVAATQILERAGQALGAALANYANIFNPEMIVIGGGLARIGDLLLKPAHHSFKAHAMPDIWEYVTVTGSSLGTKTGIYGAAAIVFHGDGLK